MAAIYLLALCDLVKTSGFSFGIATRLGSQASKYEVQITRLIHSLVQYSPASDALAIVFFHEFMKISAIQHLVAPVIPYAVEVSPEEWAKNVFSLLASFSKASLEQELKPVCNLATEYLTHLLIAVRNPGGRKTPQDTTVHPTPDIVRLQNIQHLLEEAGTGRKQSALKELIYRRDGYNCPITGMPFRGPGRNVIPRCAHIIPFAVREKSITLRTIETFTGEKITAETISAAINLPSNAFNVQNDAHDTFDVLGWGIEALEQPGGQWTYVFREVHSVAFTISLKDGDEIRFGQGHEMIDPPNPQFCNLRLALSRVMYASGASEIIERLYGDDDDDIILNQPVYFGGPFTSDDILFRRLDDRLSFG